jgi:hypothetical protein
MSTVRQLLREIAYVCAFVVVIGLLIVLIYTLQCGYASGRTRSTQDRSALVDRCECIDTRASVSGRVLARSGEPHRMVKHTTLRSVRHRMVKISQGGTGGAGKKSGTTPASTPRSGFFH